MYGMGYGGMSGAGYLFGNSAWGSSEKSSAAATVGFSVLISCCFLSQFTGSAKGIICSKKSIIVYELVTFSSSTSSVCVSNEDKPLFNLRRSICSSVSWGRLCAPLFVLQELFDKKNSVLKP